MTKPRKGQAPAPLRRDEFHLQFQRSFMDPAFNDVKEALSKVEQVAWTNYVDGHKAPITENVLAGVMSAAARVSATVSPE